MFWSIYYVYQNRLSSKFLEFFSDIIMFVKKVNIHITHNENIMRIYILLYSNSQYYFQDVSQSYRHLPGRVYGQYSYRCYVGWNYIFLTTDILCFHFLHKRIYFLHYFRSCAIQSRQILINNLFNRICHLRCRYII